MGERAPNMNWFVIIDYYGYVNKRGSREKTEERKKKAIVDLKSIHWHAEASARDVRIDSRDQRNERTKLSESISQCRGDKNELELISSACTLVAKFLFFSSVRMQMRLRFVPSALSW